MRSSIFLLGLAACSASNSGDASAYADSVGADAAPYDDETSNADTGGQATESTSVPPTWLSLAGDLSVAAGVPDPLTSELRLTGLDADLAVLCEITGPPLSLAAVDPPPVGLLAWWDVALPASESCDLPLLLRLGIGPYDTLLDPAASAAGITGTPYGLYTSPSTELWVFGVAGSADNFDGITAPVADPPLPDGLYRLESLVLLPLPIGTATP